MLLTTRRPWTAVLIAALCLPLSSATQIHSPGRCAMRGQCGSEGVFGKQLPCPDNGDAEDPSDSLRSDLVALCGQEWASTKVCCTPEQVTDLSSNLAIASSILSSCPACKNNFFNFFCTFTCSPDQSTFLNVTSTLAPAGKSEMVGSVEYLVDEQFGEAFFDSCKEVKFSTTNGFVMDFIGGGARNYLDFFRFLGEKKPGGSPFQIDFPTGSMEGMTALALEAKACNDSDPAYRCACVDCPSTCPTLPALPSEKQCYAGVIPCWSLAMILIYSIILVAILSAYSARKVFSYKQRPLRLSARSTFLSRTHTTGADSDEDEEDSLDGARPGDKFGEGEYLLDSQLHRAFYKLGFTCATYPLTTIGLCIAVVGLMCLGWLRFSVETDPVKLWVAPQSDAAKEKAFFDEQFGPFYRAEQAFLVNETGPVLSYDTLIWWFDVESRVRGLKSEGNVTLDDVCFKPVENACVVQSVTGYFGGDVEMMYPDSWQDDLGMCIEQPVACLPPFKQPLKPSLILSAEKDGVEPLESNGMITTWVVKNGVKGSEAWTKGDDFEVALRDLMLQVQSEAAERGLRLSFSTERSLEEELNKSTNTDAKIVVISYIVMFLYASLSLGSTFTFSRASLVSSKFTLGLFGILIVLLSVVSSVGIFSAFGVKTTLIIAEVIPFFVLAVGVDNIFLLVHEFQRMNTRFSDESIEQRAGRALGRMGPSILLSAVSETVAFSLGAVVGMPAVRNFAIYAAGAVVFDATLQCTMFVAALALDQKRTEANRMDCFPFVKFGGRGLGGFHYESRLTRFVRRWYAPLLIKRTTKGIINILFFGMFAAALALLPGIQLGLDQRIAIPNDSYLIDYFDDLDRYFVSGPPVYFVAQDINVTTLAGQQALCGRFSTCAEFSMANILEQERKRSEVSFIAEPAASWIDDFIQWLNPEIEKCCRIRKGTDKLCAPQAPDRMCDVCYKDHDPAWDTTLAGSPRGDEFLHYLDLWLSSVPNDDCPLGGAAAYAEAIVVNRDQKMISASHFRTSHTNLNHQQDYIAAYKAARRVAGEIQENVGGTVFPYSVFYIFFDQYISLVPLTFTLLGSALAAICVASAILLGSLTTAVLLTGTVAMIVVDVAGIMVLWGVSLNAVSLVNLVICVGIGVEFCAHVAKSFTVPNPAAVSHIQPRMGKTTEREERAMGSLVSVGASVFSGITLTKFVGVTVLAFTRSKIFEIYYFRIWLALVILAALHGLVFFPILLSTWGGRSYASLDAHDGLFEEEWQNDASQRYSEALLASDPLMGDNDSDDEFH